MSFDRSPGCLGLLFGLLRKRGRQEPVRDLGIPASADPRVVNYLLGMVTPPIQSSPGQPYSLTWATSTGDCVTWVPATPAEHVAAGQFYRAATYRSWSTPDELRELLRAERGPWVVRSMVAVGEYAFLTILDPDAPDPYRAENHGVTSSPADATPMSADAVEIAIAEHIRDFNHKPEDIGWPEPVPASRPWLDRRFALLARG